MGGEALYASSSSSNSVPDSSPFSKGCPDPAETCQGMSRDAMPGTTHSTRNNSNNDTPPPTPLLQRVSGGFKPSSEVE